MKWTAEISSPKRMKFIIQQDSRAGFNIYVYEENKCIADYLQDSLAIAKEFTQEEFGLPLDAWIEVP